MDLNVIKQHVRHLRVGVAAKLDRVTLAPDTHTAHGQVQEGPQGERRFGANAVVRDVHVAVANCDVRARLRVDAVIVGVPPVAVHGGLLHKRVVRAVELDVPVGSVAQVHVPNGEAVGARRVDQVRAGACARLVAVVHHRERGDAVVGVALELARGVETFHGRVHDVLGVHKRQRRDAADARRGGKDGAEEEERGVRRDEDVAAEVGALLEQRAVGGIVQRPLDRRPVVGLAVALGAERAGVGAVRGGRAEVGPAATPNTQGVRRGGPREQEEHAGEKAGHGRRESSSVLLGVVLPLDSFLAPPTLASFARSAL